jgi:hypothetical protein
MCVQFYAAASAAAAHLVIIYSNHEEERGVSSIDDLVAAMLKEGALQAYTAQYHAGTFSRAAMQSPAVAHVLNL